MAKAVDNTVLDGAFAIVDNAIRMAVCSAEPANYAGIAAVTLATATVSGADFTVADGDTSGRKVTIAAKSGVSITASGTATHIVLHDNSSTRLYVTTCPSQALVSGGTVDIGSWKIEIADPA
ncbi:hypothetical protein [Actinotalea sp.]|uniref:hypothetical protein n=1 Tax=Actinotalea sp. TaxID=1872145 RepID=UPI00356771E7